jgi:hypothetical protein
LNASVVFAELFFLDAKLDVIRAQRKTKQMDELFDFRFDDGQDGIVTQIRVGGVQASKIGNVGGGICRSPCPSPRSTETCHPLRNELVSNPVPYTITSTPSYSVPDSPRRPVFVTACTASLINRTLLRLNMGYQSLEMRMRLHPNTSFGRNLSRTSSGVEVVLRSMMFMMSLANALFDREAPWA